jgi:hypothetical protein
MIVPEPAVLYIRQWAKGCCVKSGSGGRVLCEVWEWRDNGFPYYAPTQQNTHASSHDRNTEYKPKCRRPNRTCNRSAPTPPPHVPPQHRLLLMKSDSPASVWLPFSRPGLTRPETPILGLVNHSGATRQAGEPRHTGDGNSTSRCRWIPANSRVVAPIHVGLSSRIRRWLPRGNLSRTRWRSLITRVCRFYVAPGTVRRAIPILHTGVLPDPGAATRPWALSLGVVVAALASLRNGV